MKTALSDPPPELATDGGLPTTTCSPSSDTPESDAIAFPPLNHEPAPIPAWGRIVDLEFARTMERDRDKYLTMLRDVAAWMKRLRDDMCDGMPILSNTMEARVAAILPVNSILSQPDRE